MTLKNILLFGAFCSSPFLAMAGTRVNLNLDFGVPAVRGEVIVRDAPPPPIVEQISMAPGPGYVWISGHWFWRDRWVWARGHWEARPRSNVAWVSGHWASRRGGWIWIEGRWVTQDYPAPGAEIAVDEAPPPPIVEQITVSPGPGYSWVSGHWGWQGGWVWIGGHYMRHPRHHAAWAPGHWESRHNRWVWIEGRWR